MMAEEIEVQRTVRPGPHFSELCPHLLRTEQCAGQRAERTAFDRRDAQIDPAGGGHWRLDDRMFASDQLDESAVRPAYHSPVLDIDAQGSAGASASPFWSSSTEI
jgi:hypothetical protein